MLSGTIKRPSFNLLISLFAHLGLLFLVGGTVLVQGVIPKTVFTGEVSVEESASNIEPLDSTLPEESTPADMASPTDSAPAGENSPVADASAFDISTITVDAASSSFNISAPGALNGDGPLASAFGKGGEGSGTGTSGKGSSGLRKIKLFATDVETDRMGVLMDVSGSAAAYIVPALAEVEKNFKDAPIVFVAGCGIGKNVPAKDVDVKKIRTEKEGERPGFLPLLQRISGRYQSKEAKAHLDRFSRQDNVWGVYLTGSLRDSTVTAKYGFDLLIREKVDSIYWFADFADAVDPGEMEIITRMLKEKNIKLIAHNFSGARVPAAQTGMADQSGGSTIRVKPEPVK